MSMKYDDDFRKTKCIGITGGVGAGKSAVLDYLREKTLCRIFYSDDEAKKLYDPQNAVFQRIKEAAGEDILKSDGSLDKKRFAARLFEDNDLRERINSIVHPAMESMILDNMALERSEGKRDFFFVEAALLVECGYDRILDELWYVYASEETRRKRLKDTRGYSDEKIRGIFDSQISEKEYREHCARVIDNDGSMQAMHASVDKILKEVSNKR